MGETVFGVDEAPAYQTGSGNNQTSRENMENREQILKITETEEESK